MTVIFKIKIRNFCQGWPNSTPLHKHTNRRLNLALFSFVENTSFFKKLSTKLSQLLCLFISKQTSSPPPFLPNNEDKVSL